MVNVKSYFIDNIGNNILVAVVAIRNLVIVWAKVVLNRGHRLFVSNLWANAKVKAITD